MLDATELSAYEEWKEKKLLGQVDLSVQAFNAEMEGQAVAYERGVHDTVKETVNPEDFEKRNGVTSKLFGDNPYRRPGMLGERPSKRITS